MSDQIDKLRKSRSAIRTCFTRGANEFEQLLRSESVDMQQAVSFYELLVTRFDRLTVLDTDLYEAMVSLDDISETDLVGEIDGCDGYRRRFSELKFRYDRHVEARGGLALRRTNSNAAITETRTSGDQQVGDVDALSGKRKFKLPKIDFLRFDGNVKDWLSFWSQFKKIHEDAEIDDNDKIGYLIQATVPGSKARQLVESFPALGANYEKIVNGLQSRFGREDLQIEVYVRELLKMILSNTGSSRKTDISVLYDKIETQLRALETLGITSDKCAAMLFPLIESCLPSELLRVWQRSSCATESLQRFPSQGSLVSTGEASLDNRLKGLMRFLQNEVENEQRIALASEGFGLHSSMDKSSTSKRGKLAENISIATVSGLVNCDIKCVFCDGSHTAESCFKARAYSFEEKKKILVRKAACFRCLKIGHQAKKCRGRMSCMLCNKSHHIMMCNELPRNKQISPGLTRESEATRTERNGPDQDSTLANHTRSHIFLQTLRIGLKCDKGSQTVRALIDTGSHRSYILKSTAAKLGYGPKRKEKLIHGLFGGTENTRIHNCFDITVYKGNYTCDFEVLDQSVICNTVHSVFHGPWSEELRKEGIEISDDKETGAPIELLIGSDIAGRLYTGYRVLLPCGLVAVETVLGWALMGKVPLDRPSSTIAMTTLSLLVNDALISKLWELDTLGITEPTEKRSKEEMAQAAKHLFLESIRLNGEGRYEVRLPWLEGHPPLSSNYKVAQKRLSSILRKMENENLFEPYDAVFQEWMAEGIIERVEGPDFPERGHYLPHRPVIKENSATTKIRPVFDASSREKDGVSLNDCLEKGINLIERIPSLLIRFRENQIGVVADIRKAFLQVSLNEKDREFLKFLWVDSDKNVVAYKHKRVVFGVNSSPFLLGATIEHHLSRCRMKCTEESDNAYSLDTLARLDKSFYVDNCVTSVADKTALKSFIRESTTIMAEAKFDLRGWEFNGCTEGKDAIVPVLGLQWDLQKDVLRICPESLKVNLDSESIIVTKRTILSLAQRIFDTIGFTCPSTLIPKLLLQRIWEQKLKWDEPVDDGTERAMRAWLEELPHLFKIEIPRWIGLGTNRMQDISLHTFCDASKRAFAAAVFLRVVENDHVKVHFMAAKARVAPLRKLTIPRLELLAAVIGVRLYANVKENLPGAIESFFWSDSTTVISWIQRQEPWGTFVWNRVAEIRSQTNPENWQHVPGEQNPADLPSRGCPPKQLLESKWWEGPKWLYEEAYFWPKNKEECDEEEVAHERRKKLVVTLLNSDNSWHTDYFSKYMKIVRTMAWIFRFTHNLRIPREKRIGELTTEEINMGEAFLLKIVQDESFSGENANKITHLGYCCSEDGLLRLKTKISNREDTESFRFPIILPSRHHVVEALILKEHNDSCHTGVQGVLSRLRERYWILGGRRTVKSALAKCLVCKRYSARSFQVEAPPLPLDRVRNAGIFEVTGVDLAGPLYMRGGDKVWVCLFTCAVYRAVHLELVTSLSTHNFIQAFRRFVARRTRPRVIYSDNGTNFTGAQNALSQLNWDEIAKDAATQRIVWRFNPPSAPWWGGFWERMIGIMKRMLRKVLGRACLNYEDLMTVICDCEAVINSRPITYESDDPKELVALSPAMFLVDKPGSGLPDCDAVDRSSLCRKLRHKQKLRDDLRQRFRNEYLGQLSSYRDKKSSRQIMLGEVVLIGNDNDKRLDWPLGRVVEFLPGKDNQVRLVRVETARGQLFRPVQRLYPLEVVDQTAEQVAEDDVFAPVVPEPQVNESAGLSGEGITRVVRESAGVYQQSRVPVVTRSGRVSIAPNRLGH